LRREGAYKHANAITNDLIRALGNPLLIAAVGAPAMRQLDRYRRRIAWTSADAA
jgi:hypothetical protein